MKTTRSIDALLTLALRQTTRASHAFGQRLVVVQGTRRIEQVDLVAASLFQQVGKVGNAAADGFKSLATALYLEAEAKAPKAPVQLNVEMGPRTLVFEDHRRVTVSWREEAEKQALVLHAIAAAYASGDHAEMQTLLKPYQGPFNGTLWESAIKAGIPKKGDLTPKINP